MIKQLYSIHRCDLDRYYHPGSVWTWSNGNEDVLHIFQSSRAGASLSYGLYYIQSTHCEGVLSPLQRCIWHILQSQLTKMESVCDLLWTNALGKDKSVCSPPRYGWIFGQTGFFKLSMATNLDEKKNSEYKPALLS